LPLVLDATSLHGFLTEPARNGRQGTEERQWRWSEKIPAALGMSTQKGEIFVSAGVSAGSRETPRINGKAYFFVSFRGPALLSIAMNISMCRNFANRLESSNWNNYEKLN
jgi:hypothetical protein